MNSRYIGNIDGHMPVLDGVRGWAIFLVLVGHVAQLDIFNGSQIDGCFSTALSLARHGNLGVDLFFVLSGFLITGILLKARKRDHFFRNFFARRVLRIFPLYYLMLALFFLFLPEQRVAGNTTGVVYYFLYLQNFAFYTHGRLEGIPSLGPTWSLAVEEHFYLVWPFVVYYFEPKKILNLTIILIAVAVCSRVAISLGSHHVSWIYHGWVNTWTICRLDSILAGAALAVMIRNEKARCFLERYRWSLAVTSLAVTLFWYRVHLVSFLGFTCVALFFASVINLLLYLQKETTILRIFDNPCMRYLGKFSYCIYLIHMPVLHAIANYMDPHRPSILLFLAMITELVFFAALIGFISWHIYEKHFLNFKGSFAAPTDMVTTQTISE